MNNNIKRVTIAKEIEDPFYLKDPKLLDLYNKCLPPKEAYYHFPKGDEIIIHNVKKPKKSFRRIFYNVPYTDLEKQWISEFKQIISSHPETQLPDYLGDYLLLTFIYATKCDLQESYKRLVKYLKFCSETFPIRITPNSKIIEILNKGFVYVYGRDNRFRPIIICQCDTFQKYYKNYQTEEILQASYFLCQFIINNMIIPGQFESWIFIINLKGVSIISLPEPVKKMIPALSDYFLSRLYKNYIMGLNFFSKLLYKIATAFLEEETIRKVNILDKTKDPKLLESIRRDNLEERFGGTAPNMPVDAENGYFPPRMPSQYFLKEDENPNDVLITEDEYINKCKRGEIADGCISPYLYDKIKGEQKEKIEQIPEQVQSNNNNIVVSELKTSASITQNKSKATIKKSVRKNNNSMIKEINLAKQLEKEKVKRFITDSNWNLDDEINFNNYHDKNDKLLRGENIFNDICEFGKKKNNFMSKISLFNSKMKNSSIISNNNI